MITYLLVSAALLIALAAILLLSLCKTASMVPVSPTTINLTRIVWVKFYPPIQGTGEVVPRVKLPPVLPSYQRLSDYKGWVNRTN